MGGISTLVLNLVDSKSIRAIESDSCSPVSPVIYILLDAVPAEGA